ncbi:helix-turn-helix domain-containing protein [Streptacidiphilus monticola]|uniref:Helix-turn-helix domain-containing protein n=1 Tax=Streptacidiphilus monticola TaxID=2161674 RepID=A0ABW1GAW8_9ACTN
MTLGEQVARLRRERGWSQRQLALEAGTTQTVVSRTETGRTVPELGTLERIARALGCRLTIRLDEAA